MKAKVTSISQAYLNHTNAMKYVDMKRDSFKDAVLKAGIPIYGRGSRTFYKISDLERMMEGFIIKKQTA